ncbi:protein phosphatase 2C domain-containing protein [Desulfobacterales bacterium HSG17]|nr:protein phosphatase 2C domain-containing protein [Desulfobacterales bacterium HSG17]
MKINTDHYFTGKNRHKPCEDYAVSGMEPLPYAILTDGCSSSPGSHMGAMLLCLAAGKHLQKIFANGSLPCEPDYKEPDYKDLGKSIILQTSFLSRFLDLPQTALDATLMIAFYKDGFVHVFVYGDGFVIAQKKEEPEPRIVEISFETNAPYYLSYQLDKARDQQYGIEMNGKKIIKSQGESLETGYDSPLFYKFSAQDFSTIIIASDGLGAFADKMNPEKGLLPESDVIREFTGFKNFNGEFVKRRARRAVNTYEKQSIFNTDDISLAGIHIMQAKQ